MSVRNAAFSTSLLLLLAIGTGCAGDETDTKQASDPRPRKVVDAGPQCAPFNAAYRDDFKACEVDADCEVAEVESGCKGKLGVFGVATAQREEFNECVPDVDSLPACIGGQDPVRAEDKRVAAEPDLANVEARCVEGSCQTQITERPCGSPELVCTRFQLCVSFLNAGLPKFTCVDNPCGNKPLDCECAEDVCVAAGEGVHTCQAGAIEKSDVYCSLEKR